MSHFADGRLTLWNFSTIFTILQANERNAYEEIRVEPSCTSGAFGPVQMARKYQATF